MSRSPEPSKKPSKNPAASATARPGDRAAEQGLRVVGGKHLGFVEQARRRTGEERRDLSVLDEGKQRVAPGRSFLATDVGECQRAIGAQDDAPQCPSSGLVESARSVGQGERALHEDAREQGGELVGISLACVAVPQRVGERRQRGEQLGAIAGLRRALLDHRDAGFDGVRQARREGGENEVGEGFQVARLIEFGADATGCCLGDGRTMDEVLHQPDRELRLPAQHPALAEGSAAAAGVGELAPGHAQQIEPMQQGRAVGAALAAQIHRKLAVERFRLEAHALLLALEVFQEWRQRHVVGDAADVATD